MISPDLWKSSKLCCLLLTAKIRCGKYENTDDLGTNFPFFLFLCLYWILIMLLSGWQLDAINHMPYKVIISSDGTHMEFIGAFVKNKDASHWLRNPDLWLRNLSLGICIWGKCGNRNCQCSSQITVNPFYSFCAVSLIFGFLLLHLIPLTLLFSAGVRNWWNADRYSFPSPLSWSWLIMKYKSPSLKRRRRSEM